MTRWNSKIYSRNGGRRYSAPEQMPSQRYLGILSRLQEQSLVHASSPDDIVLECGVCGMLCLGRDWLKHEVCYLGKQFKEPIGVLPKCNRIAVLTNMEAIALECKRCDIGVEACPFFRGTPVTDKGGDLV